MQRRSHHRRSRKRSRSFEDDDDGHLIYHSGDMLRARCIEYIPFFFFYCCSHFVSHSVVWFFISQKLIREISEIFGLIDFNYFWLVITCHCNIISIELYTSVQKPVIVV